MIIIKTELGILYNDNCLNILPTLPTDSIDLVLTDPPYNIDLKYNSYKDKRNDYLDIIKNVFSECFRLLKNKSYLVFTCPQMKIFEFRDLLTTIGFEFRHIGVWHNPKRKNGSYPGHFPYAWEPVMFFTKNGFRKLNNKNAVGSTDVWIESNPTIKHPAARPIHMWANIVSLCSNETNLVLDPFIGSGTTAVVCNELKRRWIGVELDGTYCNLTIERLSTLI